MGKRLLLISSNSSGRGGGERYLIYLTQGLRLLGCDVHALLSTVDYMDTWADLLRHEGAVVHRSPLLGLRDRSLRFLQSMLDKTQQRKIAACCQQIAPDAILVNQQYDEDGLDYLAGALLSATAPVAATMHMPMTFNKDRRPLGRIRGRLLRHWYTNHPYSLILVSQGSQKEFETYYPDPRPTHVVHHGCQFPDLTPPPALPATWTEPLPIVGFSGQLVGQKNLALLVDAWLWSIRQGVKSRLLLIGDGPERNSLETQLRTHAPEETWHITGWQEQPDRYLSVLDLYAMTSHFEGLPLALIEAVGRGVPAVVTRFNGAVDVAERASWVTVAAELSPESVGQALIQAIQARAQLKQQADAGKQAFQHYFSLERMAKDTLSAIGLV